MYVSEAGKGVGFVFGLVERGPCESDRRVTWAILTPSGRLLADAVIRGLTD